MPISYQRALDTKLLEEACDEFRVVCGDFMRLGETPEDAFDRCQIVTFSFCCFMVAKGYVAHPILLRNPMARVKKKMTMYEASDLDSHFVAWIDGLDVCVDWTARQLHSGADHPRIVAASTIKREWKDAGAFPCDGKKW